MAGEGAVVGSVKSLNEQRIGWLILHQTFVSTFLGINFSKTNNFEKFLLTQGSHQSSPLNRSESVCQ